jgi:hypothetical protein
MKNHTITRSGEIKPVAPSMPPGFVPSRPPPSIFTKIGHLLAALRRWHKEGRPITPRALRRRRLGSLGCEGCEFWAAKGNWGWGACTIKCNCTKFKAWLLTETCPHPSGSRWPDPKEFSNPQSN